MIPNFEWDPEKALANVAKHAVSFEEAATVFGDDDAVFDNDLSHSDDEDRFIIIGISARERMLLTVYTIRRADLVRIISSRRTLPHERKIYETKNRRR